MKILFITLLILCSVGCGNELSPDSNNEALRDSKQKCLIIIQRKAMKNLYPEDILNDWANEVKQCETVMEADSLYEALLDRAVDAEEGNYKLKKSSYDGSDEPIIRTRNEH